MSTFVGLFNVEFYIGKEHGEDQTHYMVVTVNLVNDYPMQTCL